MAAAKKGKPAEAVDAEALARAKGLTKLQGLGQAVAKMLRRARRNALTPQDLSRIDDMTEIVHGRSTLVLDALSDGRLAEAFAVATRTVQLWHHSGLPHNPDGTHRLRDAIDWWCARGGNKPGTKAGNTTSEDIRLKRVKRRRQQVFLARDMKELVPARDMENYYADKAALSRTKLTALVEKLVVALPAEARSAARPVIEDTINSTLADVATIWSEGK